MYITLGKDFWGESSAASPNNNLFSPILIPMIKTEKLVLFENILTTCHPPYFSSFVKRASIRLRKMKVGYGVFCEVQYSRQWQVPLSSFIQSDPFRNKFQTNKPFWSNSTYSSVTQTQVHVLEFLLEDQYSSKTYRAGNRNIYTSLELLTLFLNLWYTRGMKFQNL